MTLDTLSLLLCAKALNSFRFAVTKVSVVVLSKNETYYTRLQKVVRYQNIIICAMIALPVV